jgi:hypothetical protein
MIIFYISLIVSFENLITLLLRNFDEMTLPG